MVNTGSTTDYKYHFKKIGQNALAAFVILFEHNSTAKARYTDLIKVLLT